MTVPCKMVILPMLCLRGGHRMPRGKGQSPGTKSDPSAGSLRPMVGGMQFKPNARSFAGIVSRVHTPLPARRFLYFKFGAHIGMMLGEVRYIE